MKVNVMSTLTYNKLRAAGEIDGVKAYTARETGHLGIYRSKRAFIMPMKALRLSDDEVRELEYDEAVNLKKFAKGDSNGS